jgi:DNA-binding CsgD family transcriptional regulator
MGGFSMITTKTITSREIEVLQLLYYGATISQAAIVLDLSPHTVKVYIERAYRKLGVHNRRDVFIAAVERGIIL